MRRYCKLLHTVCPVVLHERIADHRDHENCSTPKHPVVTAEANFHDNQKDWRSDCCCHVEKDNKENKRPVTQAALPTDCRGSGGRKQVILSESLNSSTKDWQHEGATDSLGRVYRPRNFRFVTCIDNPNAKLEARAPCRPIIASSSVLKQRQSPARACRLCYAHPMPPVTPPS